MLVRNYFKNSISNITRTAAYYCTKQTNELYKDILDEDREYQDIADTYINVNKSMSCYIIQPYIKWGPKKIRDFSLDEQLDEAKALVKTLPSWSVEDSIVIPLENFDKKNLFGKGSLQKIRNILSSNPQLSLVYINISKLKKYQFMNLEKEFKLPIWDRYRIVMQILKEHAHTKHAKLQVALAELYYLQRTVIHDDLIKNFGAEKVKEIFHNRENKIKKAIQELRQQRTLLRKNRIKSEYPIVAVVGYTNAGKTSLIKALTNADNLEPKNQLFATLDVTVHSGILPSGLQILYVDTVGFISNIPTNLIECFVATLEDAVLADIILHVEDISSSAHEFKKKHVLNTLNDLASQSTSEDIFKKIFSVGNKCDLVPTTSDFGILKVSAKKGIGLDELRLKLEDAIIKITNRQKIKIVLPTGGDEIRWLYKHATIISETADPTNSERMMVEVIITQIKLSQFKTFIKNCINNK